MIVRSISELKLPVRRISAPEGVLISIVIGSGLAGVCFPVRLPAPDAGETSPQPDWTGRNCPPWSSPSDNNLFV